MSSACRSTPGGRVYASQHGRAQRLSQAKCPQRLGLGRPHRVQRWLEAVAGGNLEGKSLPRKMPITLGVVMDPVESIKIRKDSTFAMLVEAQARGWAILYMQQADLWLRDGRSYGRMRQLSVRDDPQHWYELHGEHLAALDELHLILMRKDPPFDMEYIYTTYLLELAARAGTLVVNDPRSLRDANEKLFTAWFPECCPPTLVTRRAEQLVGFLEEHGELILKPLGSMGGAGVFRLGQRDPNVNVVIETLSDHATRFVMAQRFLPEIQDGDKRILLVNGEPIPYALARIPAPGETRGNLAAGGHGKGVELSPRDRWICSRVGPVLREKGLLFVGLDIIGDYLTEINVTSPTCVREIDALYALNISAQLLDILEDRVANLQG
jgi:glutathione synthase